MADSTHVDSAATRHPDSPLYYAHLDRFIESCQRLSSTGKQYFVVVLCHELYRFLYPTEPYAAFEHDNPVPFLVRHIERLVRLAQLAEEGIAGYPLRPSDAGGAPSAAVEKQTSDLYSNLWQGYDREIMTRESVALVERRVPRALIERHIKGKTVLDIGCGSGRYAIALAQLGATRVVAIDFQAKAWAQADAICRQAALPVEFREADVLSLPFEDRSFDFVWSNGVLHHTRSWKGALLEYLRVMKHSGFLYLYATGGFFWTTRRRLRELFKDIPQPYTQSVLDTIGMPKNRMIFMDTWYVPIEGHIARAELEGELSAGGVRFEKLVSGNAFDLDRGLATGLSGAADVWGEGEHRYHLVRP